MKSGNQCVERLHRYRNALYRLKHMGFVKVFSDNLADAVGVTSAQVRKDFSMFGLSGNKRGGYQVDDLIVNLDKLLGKDKVQDVVVVGAGNIGTALLNYKGFEHNGIRIVAAFDRHAEEIINVSDVPIMPMDALAGFVDENSIEVGIIAVPDYAAQDVLDDLKAAGIKGVLNFAPIRLQAPENFIVNNIHVGLELEKVIYFVHAMDRNVE
ncbi:MAG: redox-sensing transcriptional repressor Rex [Candidatus Omnitrophota bacterium]